MNIEQARIWALQKLPSAKTYTLEVDIILSHIVKKNKSYLYACPEQKLSPLQQLTFNKAITKLASGTPVAYITGKKGFYKLNFCINNSCLVPRPETELLVTLANDYLNNFLTKISNDKLNQMQSIHIADMGTGSGVIIISLADLWQKFVNINYHATDLYSSALDVAKKNAKLHKVNINFYLGNWFEPFKKNNLRFNCIVANPPYIAASSPYLADLRHEPQHALVAKEDGIGDLQLIIKSAKNFLANKGMLILEHGFDQKNQVNELLQQYGYRDINNYKDLAGQDRAITAMS